MIWICTAVVAQWSFAERRSSRRSSSSRSRRRRGRTAGPAPSSDHSRPGRNRAERSKSARAAKTSTARQRLVFQRSGTDGRRSSPTRKESPARFRVAVASTVPVGFHDVRLVGKYGVSNPRTFVVSDWNEAVETEPNNDRAHATRVPLETRRQRQDRAGRGCGLVRRLGQKRAAVARRMLGLADRLETRRLSLAVQRRRQGTRLLAGRKRPQRNARPADRLRRSGRRRLFHQVHRLYL